MRASLFLALLATLPRPAIGQQSAADSIVGACIERDTSTAWQRKSAEWSMERPGSWSNDSLRRVLIAMAAEDQAVRPATGTADSMKNPAFVRRMARQDSIGLAQLREIVRRFGWPTKSMVGASGASAAFLIAQHNEAYQPEALRLMRALPAGEVQASELAMLEDRILVFSGRAQKYATQLKPPTATGVEFYPIDSVSRVEARRAAVGLPPMSVYLCMMRGFTGRAPRYPPAQTPARPASMAEFERQLEQLRSDARIPGITAGISRGQRVVWARGFGYADVEARVRATDTTVYHLASLTKPFAATILLQLVNEGKISLDDPVAKYSISLIPATILVRHLLSHTSEGVPGTAYRYNGARFGRLDAVIRQADGRDFASAFEARIRKPLRLRWIAPNPGSPSFEKAGFDMGTFYRNFARGYSTGRTQAPTAYPTQFSSAAGLTASAREVLAFSMALDRGALLPDSLKTLAFTPTRTNAGQATPYGLGWFTTEYRGVKVVWHYGYWTANSSLIIKVPDRELTFVVLANTAALSQGTQLGAGRLETSPWARAFLDRYVIDGAALP